jgi:hypothetical protein
MRQARAGSGPAARAPVPVVLVPIVPVTIVLVTIMAKVAIVASQLAALVTRGPIVSVIFVAAKLTPVVRNPRVIAPDRAPSPVAVVGEYRPGTQSHYQ